MAIISPTITAQNPHIYREQMNRIEPFAKRVHIDLMDGVFAPSKSVAAEQVWLPENIISDIHVMFQYPEAVVKILVELQPHLIIVPAESTFDFATLRKITSEKNVQLGIALLAETPVHTIIESITHIDHALIFSGNLGYQGGSVADLSLLDKVAEVKSLNPNVEIGWDGGVDDQNVQQLAEGGINIINVGGFIHTAPDAGVAYTTLTTLLP